MVYKTQGVCSMQITYDIEEVQRQKVVRNVQFMGGCHGNLQGIAHLVEGMPVAEVVKRLRGIRCGYKSTSCPDQLAQALMQHM